MTQPIKIGSSGTPPSPDSFSRHFQRHVSNSPLLSRAFEGSLESLFEKSATKEDEPHLKEAVEELLGWLQIIPEIGVKNIYDHLFKILPFLDETSMSKLLEENVSAETLKKSGPLQELLNQSSSLQAEQRKLALFLAFWHIKQAQALPFNDRFLLYQRAMNYFAIAIKISDPQSADYRECHLYASQLVLKVLKSCFFEEDHYKKKLRIARNEPERFKELFHQIEEVKRFCLQEEDKKILESLYTIVFRLIPQFEPTLQERFNSYTKGAGLLRNQPFDLSSQYPTERYYEKLQEFRKHFGIFLSQNSSEVSDVRAFQTTITKKLEELLQVFLKDAFAILGSPPCAFDLRVVGSAGRKELCSFSDLEIMLLVGSEGHENYFTNLIQVLDLLIISLGETPLINLNFTCIHKKNPSGFHVDFKVNPVGLPNLMGTPQVMAQHQKEAAEPQTIPQFVRKSISLSTGLAHQDPGLFDTFQKEMQIIWGPPKSAYRRELFLQMKTKRIEDFDEAWKNFPNLQNFNLKEQFINPLHILSDMSLFWGVDETNTLDIIDALIREGVFTSSCGILLQEAVANIYTTRLRLHESYQEQKEEGYTSCITPFEPQFFRGLLKKSEQRKLEKFYWLVLRPLYNCLRRASEQELEKVFCQMDLLSMAFEEACVHKLKPCIVHCVEAFVERKVPLDQHVKNFKRLSEESDSEPLREAYLEVLEQYLPTEFNLHDQIADIPNRAGLRLSFERNLRKLRATLAFTLEFLGGRSLVEIIGSTFAPHYLHSDIFDENADIRNSSGHISRRIFTTNLGLQLEQAPIYSLREYAADSLLCRLAGSLTRARELVCFEVGKDKSYPVLVTEVIPAKPLSEDISLNANTWSQWTWMLLGSILIRPLHSHYSLDAQNNLFCTQGECFENLLDSERKVQFFSDLFCFFSNKPLESKVLQDFCNLDVDAILKGWMEELIGKEQEHRRLFPTGKRKAIFREGMLATLKVQFRHLQNYLSTLGNKEIRSLDLLKQMISIGEYPAIDNEEGLSIHEYYQKVMKLPTLEARLRALKTGEMEHSLEEKQERSWASVYAELDENFLERTKNHITTGRIQGKKIIHTNLDGKQLNEEGEKVVFQELSRWVEKEKPASVTVQSCSVLDSSNLKLILHENLEYLDLRNCKKITDADVRKIQASCLRLKVLNLSGCSGLKKIESEFTKLEELHIEHCQNLLSLRLKAPLLKTLQACSNPQLTAVELVTDNHPFMSFKESHKLDEKQAVKLLTTKGEFHTSRLSHLVFSRTVTAVCSYGARLLVGFEDGVIRFLNRELKEKARISIPRSRPITALAAKSDRLVAGDDQGNISIWNLNTRQKLGADSAPGSSITAFNFSEDGRMLAYGTNTGMVFIYDLVKNEMTKSFKAQFRINRLFTLEKEKRLALLSVANNILCIWDNTSANKGHPQAPLKQLSFQLKITSFAPLGETAVAIGYSDGSIQILNVGSYQELRSIKRFKAAVLDLSFSPQEKKLAALYENGTLVILDTGTWKDVAQIELAWGQQAAQRHQSFLSTLTFLGEGKKLALRNEDQTLLIWNFDDPTTWVKIAQQQALQKNYAEAVKFFELAAQKGHPEAQCQLGALFYKGEGVVKNEKEAVKWYQKAAAQNFPLAHYYLGSCLLYGKGIAQNPKEGIELYFKAAEQGVVPAQYYLGRFHRDGNFVPKDIKKSLEWFQKAAAQGDLEAKFELAELYKDLKNYPEALKIYQIEAEKGNPHARCQLGVFHFKGWGVSQNDKEAVFWYQKAADQNFPLAQYYLGSCLFHGKGTEKDILKGLELHRQAALQGVIPAQYYLGIFYLKGQGVPKDEQEALKWFQMAADQGDRDAQIHLSSLKRLQDENNLRGSKESNVRGI